VISYEENKGKWYALKIGYFNAKKKFVLFLDADLSVDFDILQDLWEEKLFKKDVLVIGNRYLGEAVLIPVRRLIASRIFNKLARKITGIEVADSQCPAKLLSKTKKMNDVMWFMKEKGFCGDVELLVRVKKAGIKIREFYAIYDFQEGSSVSIRKHAPGMLKALFRIRRYM
jgi:glycosyltransferase involved in cell wall biosynthesis